MTISRREFLKLSVAATIAGAAIPAFAMGREPYVLQEECVSHIGLTGGFIGSAKIKEILPWDGVGYPVILRDQGFCGHDMPEPIYDSELCNFNRELPPDFWANHRGYHNVHAWVREQRYGEDPATYRERCAAAREAA